MDIFVNDDEGMLDCPEGLLVAQGVYILTNDKIVHQQVRAICRVRAVGLPHQGSDEI